MTNDASYAYTYDAEGRITTANGVTYTYDGNGLRVEKSSGKLYWRDIFGDAIAETDSTGSTTNASYHEYVFMAGRRIASRDGLGNVNYYYADALGSTVTLTDGGGNACYETTYTPYGEEHATMTNCSTNYKFAGYEQDAETGLYYAMARYYNPRLGRFMTPDPLMGDIRNPQTLNRYAYVANNPLNLIDPLGLSEEAAPPYTCVVGGDVIAGESDCILAQLEADDPCGTGTGPCDSSGGGGGDSQPGQQTKCNFNVKLKNSANLDPSQITAAENRINSLFGAAGVGVNFTASGSSDYALNFANAGSGNSDLGDYTSFLFFHGTPTVYPNNILSDFPTQPANVTNNIIGTVGAHELVHRITGIGDIPFNSEAPYDLMSLDRNPNFYNVLPQNTLILTPAEAQKLRQDCLNKHPS